MKTPHTQGPWVVLPGTAKVLAGKLYIQDGVCNGHEGFEIAWPAKGTDRKSQLANAKLIAAAPDLLEALQDLEDALTHSGPCQCCQGSNDDGHDERCSIIKARAAIAKATH